MAVSEATPLAAVSPLAAVAQLLGGVGRAAPPACAAILARAGRPLAPHGGDRLPAPERLSAVYAEALAEPVRRRGGVWYTPPALAEALARAVLDLAATPAPVVLDPACGGGAFLLAAARAQAASAGPAVLARLAGCDTDPDALLVARASLELLASEQGWDPAAAGKATLTCRDFLAAPPPPAADVILGNPPFLSQLRRRTARDPAARAALGGRARGYVDGAALFLEASVRAVRQGGLVCLVLPASVLGARDASAVRDAVARETALVELWLDGTPRAFRGGVPVCAPVLRRGAVQGPVRRRRGIGFAALPDAAPPGSSWAPLLVDARAVPDARPRASAGRLGDVATVSADFRDQYYGLAALVCEAAALAREDRLPLITTGLVDPAHLAWGERPARFARRSWERPAVSRTALLADARLGRWARTRLVPKVLVASQAAVPEAVVDSRGNRLPLPPLLVVVPQSIDLFAAAAAISSPVAAAWAWRRGAGTALSLDSIKISAAQLRELPLPGDTRALAEAGARLRAAHGMTEPRAHLRAAAIASCRAYGLSPAESESATAWWLARVSTGYPAGMATKDHGASVKDDRTYEKVRKSGASKEKAARIANAKAGGGNPSKKGGKASSYEDQTKEQLRKKAADVGIDGRSKMSKGELIDALRNH